MNNFIKVGKRIHNLAYIKHFYRNDSVYGFIEANTKMIPDLSGREYRHRFTDYELKNLGRDTIYSYDKDTEEYNDLKIFYNTFYAALE